jgi:hypothetical protein
MIVDHYIDMEDDSGHLWIRAWRCIACGDVVDSQIRRRRMLLRSALAHVKRVVTGQPADEAEVVALGV